MKKLLLAFAAAAVFFAGADEEYEFDKIADWLPTKGVTQKGGNLVVKNQVMLRSKKMFDIQSGKVYKLEFEAKRLEGKAPLIFAGFELFRENGKTPVSSEHVNGSAATFCTVVKDVKKGDTVVYLDANAGKWRKISNSYLAPGAKKDFSDLPNYRILYFPVKEIEKCPEGYKFTLLRPIAGPVAKGTAVRQHISGGYMYAAGYKALKGDDFVKFQGVVKDILPAGPGYPSNKWTSYASKARIIILVNWGREPGVTELKDIELEIDNKK